MNNPVCLGGFCGRGDGSVRACASDAIDGTAYCAIHQYQHVLMPQTTPAEYRAQGAAERQPEIDALLARIAELEAQRFALGASIDGSSILVSTTRPEEREP